MSYFFQSTNMRKYLVYCRVPLSGILCSPNGYMAYCCGVRNSLCAIFNEHLQIYSYMSQVEIAPLTEAQQNLLNCRGTLNNRECLTNSERIGTCRCLSHPPPASVFHGDTTWCCLPESIAEELWCDCSTSLQPALRPWLVVILLPCVKTCPLHFGRLHNWVYLQMFSTRNPHLLVCLWFVLQYLIPLVNWSPVLSLRL